MTVHDDLATLRDYFGPPGKFSPEWKSEGDCAAALARVEDKIARLERKPSWTILNEWRKRAEAAEAEVALVEQEREEYIEIAEGLEKKLHAAEAEIARNRALMEAVVRDIGVEALLEGVKAICAEPTTTGPPHDKATRITSYRALREILEPLVRRVETGQ